jgi:hypothetical protein
MIEEVIDGPESGFSNAAIRYGNDIIALSYFYRNSFYKGIKIYRITPNGLTQSILYIQSRDTNPGWRLMVGATHTGRIMVSYEDNGYYGKRVYYLYKSYAVFEKNQRAEPIGWENQYDDFFVMAGVGSMYGFWRLWSDPPPAKDVGGSQNIITTDYNLSSAMIHEFSFEARYGSCNLALSYLKSFISKKIEEDSKSARSAFNYITSVVGWDKLFFGLDAQITSKYSHIQGSMKENGAKETIFDSDYKFLSFSLLNAYRLRYSLFYQNYDFYIPIYVYKVNQGEKEYTFVQSLGADVTFHDVGGTIGYSRLDYAVKYENKVFDWFVGGNLGIGLSNANVHNALFFEEGQTNISSVTTYITHSAPPIHTKSLF